MTQLIFKNDIDQSKIDVLLSMIKSWNIEAEIAAAKTTAPKIMPKKPDALTLSVGLWENRDVNDKQLRDLAWGTTKRQKNGTL